MRSDRLAYCVDCGRWDATLKEFLERCRVCASPHIHQAPHEKWARRFLPHMGYVNHGLERIPVTPGTLAFAVLSLLQRRYT
jgi:hypothetical protein